MPRRSFPSLALATCAALMLTGCSPAEQTVASSSAPAPSASSDLAKDDSRDDTGDSASEGPLKTFETPLEFSGQAVPLSLDAVDANVAGDVNSRLTLAGEQGFGVTDTGVGSVDLATGELLWETRFPDAPESGAPAVFYDTRGPGAPVLSTDGSIVFAALVVTLPGGGTVQSSRATQLMAVDAESGDLLWTVEVPEPESSTTDKHSVDVVTVDEERVLVNRPGDGLVHGGFLIAIDPATEEVLWSATGSVEAVVDNTVVATTVDPDGQSEPSYPQLSGLDLTTGEKLWTSGTEAETAVNGVQAAETHTGLAVTVNPYSGADPYTAIMNPSTGETSSQDPGVLLFGPVVDGGAVFDIGNNRVRALDPETLDALWELPSGNRTAPRGPVVFGGNIYGRVGNGLSVVLDGSTGEDASTNIPGTFVEVNEHGAVMIRDQVVVFVPATA